MFAPLVDLTGTAGAALTTLCWLPQALKVLRERETRGLSLTGTAGFTAGMGLWLLYGLGIGDWPLQPAHKKFAVPGGQGSRAGPLKAVTQFYATNDRSMFPIARRHDVPVTADFRLWMGWGRGTQRLSVTLRGPLRPHLRMTAQGRSGKSYFAGVTRRMRPAALSVSR